MKKSYSLDQSYLFKCKSKKRLAKALGISVAELKHISDFPEYHFFIKDNGVKKRKIDVPNKILKKAQKAVYRYLKHTKRPQYLMAGEAGKSLVSNGKFHKDSNYWLKFDVSNFFPNCKREYVYRFFKVKMQCSPDIANILTDITIYDGGLVQGSSTSMVLSFFAFIPMFNELSSLALKNNLKFSTYVDDFTFSSLTPINTPYIKKRVNQIVRAYGHTIKKRKVKYYLHNEPKRVSGVIVTKDHKLRVPNRNRQKILHLFEEMKDCDEKKQFIKSKKIKRSLIGCINSARQIEPEIFPEILRAAKM